MMKRFLAALLALTMVLAMVPLAVQAEPAAVTKSPKAGTHTGDGHSDDCGLTTGWTAWTSTTSLPTSGQYYLTADVTLTNEVQVSGDLTLCLNGYVITTTAAKRLISTKDGAGVTFTITDCTAYTEDDVYYAGALTGGKDASAGGGAVFVRRSNTLKLYDGRITSNTSSIAGGGIALQANGNGHTGGKLYMFGGEIAGNTAINGTTYKTGGGLYMGGTCLFEMTGGTISGNKGSGGGAIYTVGADITITTKDATITGNTASYTGAAIHCGGATTVTLEDTTITGNTCTNTSAGGTIRMDAAGGKVILSGKTVVAGNSLAPKIGDIMLMNTTSNKLNVNGLTGGSNVRFCAPNTTVTAAGDVITAGSAQTDWDSSWVTFVEKSGTEQHIAYNGSAFSFAAGHFHGETEFLAWTKTDSLPASGAYYLTSDVSVSKQVTVSGELKLCLNGHKVTGYKGRAFDVTGSLTLCSCTAGSSFSGFGNNAHGGVIQSSGTIYAENLTFTSNDAGTGYGGVLLSTKGDVTFKDCVFTGNKAAQGSAVSVAGATTITGCTFTGNTASASGGLRAVGSQPILVENSTFTGNTAKSCAAIQTGSTSRLALKDVTITGNTNTVGYGAVNAMGATPVVTLQGKVVITGNTTNGQAQNLHLQNGTTDGFDVSGLTAGSSIGVSLEGSRITANRMHFSTASSANKASYFVSDNDAYRVILGSDNKLALELIPVADHKHDLCGNTDCPDHEYTEYFAWNKTDSLPAEGNWYLTADVSVSKQVTVSGELKLCLNGHKVTGYKGRAFDVTGSLTLCSCTAGSSFSGFGNNAHGGVIQSSGTIYAENLTFTSNDAGTGYGGVLLSTKGDVTFKDCVFTDNKATQGSAVSVAGASTIIGCTFTDNTASASGTLRAVGSQPILVENCTFTGNTAKAASAIQTNSSSLLTLKDVTITGNSCTTGYGAVNATGSIQPVALQGKVVITGNVCGDKPQNLHLQNGTTDGYDMSGLTAGSSIGVSLETARITAGSMHFTTANENNNPSFFVSDDNTYEVALDKAGKLILQIPLPPITHIHCICGKTANTHCDHAAVDFTDWTHADSLPSEGTWCLTTDVSVTKQTAITGELTLCLNGHSIKTTTRVFHCSTGAKLTITDCAKTPGTISGATNSAILFATNSQDTALTLWNGVFADNHLLGGGAAVVVQGETVFNMYGGTFTGNWAESAMKVNSDGTPVLDASGNPTCYSSNGGALFAGPGTTFNFYGGTFTGNKATHVEYYKKDATSVTKSGGNGGAMAIYGTANLYGGIVCDNDAFLGGGVFVSGSQGTLNLLGTEISGNRGYSAGGVLSMSKSTINMQAGSVSNNAATLSGGGIYVSTGTKLIMTGGEVTGNTSGSSGAGIYLLSSKAELTDCKLTGNVSKNLGGAIFVYNKSELILNSGSITGNQAVSGSGVFVNKESSFTMNSGNIDGNKSTSSGGGVSVFEKSTFHMKGGSISRNTAKNDGGGLYLLRSTVNFGAGTISGNTGANGGGMKICGGTITFSGTTITGNQAVGKYVTSSTTGQQVYTAGSGGGINAAQAGYKENGVQKQETPVITVNSFYLAHNKATSAAGGLLVQSKGSRFTMYSGTITGNEATVGGGGVYFSIDTINKVHGGTISNNTSMKAGGIFILNCTAELSNMTITGNKATSVGGAAIISGKNAVVTMKNMAFTDNSCETTGGAAVVQGYSTMSLENGVVSGNTAKATGGFYFSNPATAHFKNVEFFENTSQADGGAVYVSKNCPVVLEDCTLRDNSTGENGGAVYTRGRVAFINSKVLNNTAGVDGGAVASGQSASFYIADNVGIYATNTIFSGNQAGQKGGAIHSHRGAPCYLTDAILTENTSGAEGSAIYSDGRMGLENITITGNTGTYALYYTPTVYDGHSYNSGHRWLRGNVQVKDNDGGDMYLSEGTIVAVAGETLDQGSLIHVQLQAGFLTQQLQGVYDYEGGDLVYTVTPGSRSITDPEVYAEQAAPAETNQGNNTVLYIAIGAIALAVIAAAVLVISKKKTAPGATKE